MSGGSYNYVYHRHWNGQWESIPDDLHRMAESMRNQGEPEAARAVETYCARLEAHLDAMEAEADLHLDFLKAIEWWESSDWGPEPIREALKALPKISDPG